jgi:hypothetical protein
MAHRIGEVNNEVLENLQMAIFGTWRYQQRRFDLMESLTVTVSWGRVLPVGRLA